MDSVIILHEDQEASDRQKKIETLVHQMIYGQPDYGLLQCEFMEEPIFAMIRSEVCRQMKNLKENRDIIVNEAFHAIVIHGHNLQLLVLSLIPAVWNLWPIEEDNQAHEYDVLDCDAYLGRATYHSGFYVGPDPQDPSVMRLGANVEFIPTDEGIRRMHHDSV